MLNKNEQRFVERITRETCDEVLENAPNLDHVVDREIVLSFIAFIISQKKATVEKKTRLPMDLRTFKLFRGIIIALVEGFVAGQFCQMGLQQGMSKKRLKASFELAALVSIPTSETVASGQN